MGSYRQETQRKIFSKTQLEGRGGGHELPLLTLERSRADERCPLRRWEFAHTYVASSTFGANLLRRRNRTVKGTWWMKFSMLEQENELGKHQQESPGVTETRVNRAPGGDFKRSSKMQPVSVLLQASLQVSKIFLSAEEWQTAELISFRMEGCR